MQDSCIGTYMAMWFAASIPPSPALDIYPDIPPQSPPHPAIAPLALPPPTDPSV